MKQNNQPKNPAAGDVATTQNSVSGQIRIAKARQLANAAERAKQGAGRKSMAAVATTPAQSEITSKPPNLYQVTRINTPADFPEVARLLSRELNKIAESQSYILTLWEKLRGQAGGQAGGQDYVDFSVPVDFSAGITIYGMAGFNPIPEQMQSGGTDFDAVPFGWSLMGATPTNAPADYDGYGVSFAFSMQGTRGYKTIKEFTDNALTGSTWAIQFAIDTHAAVWIRNFTNTAPWADWKTIV
jgi:hypothetical protein